MSRLKHNRRPVLLLPVFAVATTFALTACGNNGVAEQSKEHSVVTGGEGQVGDVRILDATLTTGLSSDVASLSVTVYDQGQDGDSLTAVSSPVATGFVLPTAVGASDSASTDATGASSTTSAVAIPAMSTLPLRDSDAIGVTGLTGSPEVGDSVSVTFTFAGAGSVTLAVPVVGSQEITSVSTPTPAVTGAGVDGGDPSPAVSAATG